MDEKRTYFVDQVGQMYLRHGIRSVTMDDVATELGISKKTLYQYFNDKADLVEQVVGHFLMKDECYHAQEDESLNAIDRFFWIRKHVFDVMKIVHNNLEYDLKKSYPDVYKKITDYKRHRIYEDNFSIMEQGKKEGLFREEVDSELIAKLTVGRMLFVFNTDNGIFSDEDVRSMELFDRMLDYHFHGVCTEKGIAYFKKQLNNVQNED